MTLNPSIDMSYQINHLKINQITRSQSVSKTAGGKGINVSRVIELMGYTPLATGFLGGHFGAFIEDKLRTENIDHDFFHINQETRNSIALLHDKGKQTEILESGPQISKEESQNFLINYKKLLKGVDLVTISGSLPPGLDKNYYARMISIAKECGIKVLLDSSGSYLKEGISGQNKPYLIKPNKEEIKQLIGKPIIEKDFKQLSNYLFQGSLKYIPWIVISLGKMGALAEHDRKVYRVIIPKVKAVNPVGSGDSTLAGLAIAISRKETDQKILKTGMTTGILNALERKTGFINKNLFSTYFNKIKIKKIDQDKPKKRTK